MALGGTRSSQMSTTTMLPRQRRLLWVLVLLASWGARMLLSLPPFLGEVASSSPSLADSSSPSHPSGNGARLDGGLSYQLYDNAVLKGPPVYEGLTHEAFLSLKAPLASVSTAVTAAGNHPKAYNTSVAIWSGSLTGSLSLAVDDDGEEDRAPRWYNVSCDFAGTATGWVRIGSHLVCHDGHAYTHPAAGIVGLRPHQIYAVKAFLARNTTHKQEEDEEEAPPPPRVFFSWSKLDGAVAASHQHHQRQDTSGKFETMPNQERLQWHPSSPIHEVQREKLFSNVSRGWGQWLLPDLLEFAKLPEGFVLGLKICVNTTTTDASGSNNNATNTYECLGPVVPDSVGTVKVDTHAIDRSYAKLYVTYQGFSLTIESSVSTSTRNNHTKNDELLVKVTILEPPPRARSSETEEVVVEVVPRYAWFRPGSVTKDPRHRNRLVASTPGLGTIIVETFRRGGNESHYSDESDATSLALRIPLNAATGGSVAIRAIPGGPKNDEDATTGTKEDGFATVARRLRTTKERNARNRLQKFGPAKQDVAKALEATVMWSWTFAPIEESPLLPVSRSPSWAQTFAGKAGAVAPEWTYVIFEWDNLFASLLAGLFDKEIAYANLWVSVRSMTTDGFLPNWSTAGGIRSSGDRTEPPVGAKVLLELYQKYGDDWIVKALWEDLVEWNDWFVRERTLEPLGLIGLGSFQEQHGGSDADNAGEQINNLQAARYESGLDNSPMYDGDEERLYDKTTHKMQMYDVGMSALVAHEAYCLARLADLVGMDPQKRREQRARGDRLRDNIWKHLWDPSRSIFANRYRGVLPGTNDTFVRAITPTSVYPLLLPLPDEPMALGHGWVSREALDDVIESMVGSWLLNAMRFCLSPNGDFEGNDPAKCYWGLPSVSADDPTYMVPGKFNYWRGLVWGPMAQIVYWSLSERQRLWQQRNPSSLRNADIHQQSNASRRQLETAPTSMSNSTRARKSLCSQMEALMMSQWSANRHICENYSPFRNATECSGTLFYHWGALNGLIGMIEEGHYDAEDSYNWSYQSSFLLVERQSRSH